MEDVAALVVIESVLCTIEVHIDEGSEITADPQSNRLLPHFATCWSWCRVLDFVH